MASKYTKSARGQDCQIRLEGVCNYNPKTTVFAHLPGAGMGMKHADIHGTYACSNCHDVIDGRMRCDHLTNEQIKLSYFDGLVRTQQIMIRDGVLKL